MTEAKSYRSKRSRWDFQKRWNNSAFQARGANERHFAKFGPINNEAEQVDGERERTPYQI